MHNTTKHKILAIDPGTRAMGVALLEGPRLIYHGVKTFSPAHSPHELLKEARGVISRLIRDFSPHMLAVEKTFFANNRNSALLNVLADEVAVIGRRKQLQVLRYAPNTVKKRICGNGHASKEAVARVVVARFPELKVFLTQDRKWKERFHENMFDAVAVGLVASAAEQTP